jgi:hypothetical protein
MPSIAARRPARLDRAPRFTRATAPAHSNPSCTGAVFLDFASFIEQNSHKEKRDPNSRSTLRHSIGPSGTRIPPGKAVLAFLTTRSAGRPACHSRGSSRETIGLFKSPSRESTPKSAIGNNRLKPLYHRQTRSLCHRITRHSTLIRDILATQASRRPKTGNSSTMRI